MWADRRTAPPAPGRGPDRRGPELSPVPPPDWPPVSFTLPGLEQQQPELRRVRDRLLAAIRDRRVDRVRALMAPTITDQDDRVPVDEILASFGPLEPGAPLPEEWQALEQALRLGGILRDGVYVLPFIEREAPAWRAGTARLFVAGENVGVRTEPEPHGARGRRGSGTRCSRKRWACRRVPAPPDPPARTGRR